MSRPLPPLNVPVLVGCAAAKLAAAAAAADLYSPSRLFRATRALARRSAAGWGVLSARYHLLRPDQVVEPYDLRITQLRGPARDAWGVLVREELLQRWPEARRLVVLAGADYVRALERALGWEWEVEAPLAGLGVGSRYAQLVAWQRAADLLARLLLR